jgi:hypothetical protein
VTVREAERLGHDAAGEQRPNPGTAATTTGWLPMLPPRVRVSGDAFTDGRGVVRRTGLPVEVGR